VRERGGRERGGRERESSYRIHIAHVATMKKTRHIVYVYVYNLVWKPPENIPLEDREKERRKQEDMSQGAAVWMGGEWN
jgi:ribosomal protein S16